MCGAVKNLFYTQNAKNEEVLSKGRMAAAIVLVAAGILGGLQATGRFDTIAYARNVGVPLFNRSVEVLGERNLKIAGIVSGILLGAYALKRAFSFEDINLNK